MAGVIYKCSVNGNLGSVRYGRRTLGAICGKIKVGEGSICGAHGNTKCEYKIKEVRNES